MQIITLLTVVVFAGVVSSCSTSGSYADADKHRRYVSVYSTDDQRAALSSPKNDSAANETLANLGEKVKANRSDLKSWLNIARLRLARGEILKAEKACNEALRIDFKSQAAKKVYAQISLRKGDHKVAKVILESMGGESLRDSQVHNLLAQVYLAEDNRPKAMALFKRSIALDSSNASARMNLGVMYVKYRQLSAAAIQFERVLQVMPKNIDARLHLGIIQTTRKEYEPAEEAFAEVLAIDPNNSLALFNLAVVQMHRGEYDDAIDNLKSFVRQAKRQKKSTDEGFALIDRVKVLRANGGKIPDSQTKTRLAAKLRKARSTKKKAKVKPRKRVLSKDEQEIQDLEKTINQ